MLACPRYSVPGRSDCCDSTCYIYDLHTRMNSNGETITVMRLIVGNALRIIDRDCMRLVKAMLRVVQFQCREELKLEE